MIGEEIMEEACVSVTECMIMRSRWHRIRNIVATMYIRTIEASIVNICETDNLPGHDAFVQNSPWQFYLEHTEQYCVQSSGELLQATTQELLICAFTIP